MCYYFLTTFYLKGFFLPFVTPDIISGYFLCDNTKLIKFSVVSVKEKLFLNICI